MVVMTVIAVVLWIACLVEEKTGENKKGTNWRLA